MNESSLVIRNKIKSIITITYQLCAAGAARVPPPQGFSAVHFDLFCSVVIETPANRINYESTHESIITNQIGIKYESIMNQP
jgi:hypothetical protein